MREGASLAHMHALTHNVWFMFFVLLLREWAVRPSRSPENFN